MTRQPHQVPDAEEFYAALEARHPLRPAPESPAVQPFSSERKAKNEYRNKNPLENAG